MRPGALDLRGEHRLDQLALEGALALGVDVLHELLGDRRTALRAARHEVDGGGARETDGIDRAVLVEALVLDRDGRVLHDLRDLLGLDQLAVLVARAEDREHRVPVAGVDHAVRRRAHLEGVEVLDVLRDRRREAVEGRDERERHPEQREDDPARPATARALRLRRCRRREAEGRRRPGGVAASQDQVGQAGSDRGARAGAESNPWTCERSSGGAFSAGSAAPGLGYPRPPWPIPSSLIANAVDVLPSGELERRLARAGDEKRPLRVKLGIDPTAPVVTLGHAVVLTTLRAFQDAGHQAVLIVGDYTARVGDPSGRSKARPMLTPEEIEHNVAGAARRVRTRARSRARRGAPQLRVARAARHRRSARARGAHHGRAPARARRLRQAPRGPRADLAAGAALPAPAGVRLGRDPRGHRARRHRSEVQPADGARPAGVVRAGAADRLHPAAARRHGRRAQDEQVARQLRRPARRARTSCTGA